MSDARIGTKTSNTSFGVPGKLWHPALVVIVLGFIAGVAQSARAAEAGATLRPSADSTRPIALAETDFSARGNSFPILAPVRQHWAAILVISIFGLFFAAAVIGPIVRANAPDEVFIAHAHDEPPGSSHHHGATGTLQSEPSQLDRR